MPCCSSTRRRSSTASTAASGSAVPPILRSCTPTSTRDGRSVQLNLSGTERWREVCRLVGLDPDGECGLDFSSPESLGRLSDRAWITRVLDELTRRFGERSADEWEAALLDSPAAVAKCNTLEEWLAHEQARVNDVFMSVDDAGLGRLRLAGPPVRVRAADTPVARGRRHGSGNGALGGKRIVDLSSFWAGPLAARPARRVGRRRGQGRAAGGRRRVPADARAAEHLRRRQSVEARHRPRSPSRGRSSPSARARRRGRRRGRERGRRHVGTPGIG